MSITLKKTMYAVKNLATDELVLVGTRSYCEKNAKILQTVAQCGVVKVKVTGTCDNFDVTEMEVI